MEKAYDVKALGLKLKAAGLPLAEEALEAGATKAYVALKELIKESAALSDNKIDDVISPFIDQLDQVFVPFIKHLDLDKDGK
jgi:hypothetical protein